MAMLAEDIGYFVEIARQASLGKAAAKLGISQPALTKSIHRLERRLQIKLFERTSGGVALTPIGEVFYERARIVGTALDEALREVRNLRLGLAGEVKLGMSPAVPFALIAQIHERFARASPSASLLVTSLPTPALIRSLAIGELDLVLGMQQWNERREISYEKMYEDTLQIAVSSHHPLLSRKPLSAAALLEHPWVLPRREGFVHGWIERNFRALGLQRPMPIMEIDSIDHTISLAATARTEVVAVVPGRILAQHAKQLPVRALHFPEPIDPLIEFGIYVRRDGYLSPAASKLLAAVRTSARSLARADR